jgi:hypothetical protein
VFVAALEGEQNQGRDRECQQTANDVHNPEQRLESVWRHRFERQLNRLERLRSSRIVANSCQVGLGNVQADTSGSLGKLTTRVCSMSWTSALEGMRPNAVSSKRTLHADDAIDGRHDGGALDERANLQCLLVDAMGHADGPARARGPVSGCRVAPQ